MLYLCRGASRHAALMLTNIFGSHLRYQISYYEVGSWSFKEIVILSLYPDRFPFSDLSVVVLDVRTLWVSYILKRCV